jgi:hypothetical protein
VTEAWLLHGVSRQIFKSSPLFRAAKAASVHVNFIDNVKTLYVRVPRHWSDDTVLQRCAAVGVAVKFVRPDSSGDNNNNNNNNTTRCVVLVLDRSCTTNILSIVSVSFCHFTIVYTDPTTIVEESRYCCVASTGAVSHRFALWRKRRSWQNRQVERIVVGELLSNDDRCDSIDHSQSTGEATHKFRVAFRQSQRFVAIGRAPIEGDVARDQHATARASQRRYRVASTGTRC